MKAKILMAAVIAAILSAAATYSVVKTQTAAAVSSKTSEATAATKGITIAGLKTVAAVAGEGWDAVVVTGKVSIPPHRMVKIGPRISGKIVAAYATVGDTVRKGQTLAIVSSMELAEARSEHRQATARLNAARKDYDQQLRTAKLGVNSVRPLEEARADSLEAQGDVADAKSELLQAKSDLVQSEAELVQCKSRLERARELYADKIVSRQDLETAEAEFKKDSAVVEASRNKISQAEAALEKSKSRAEIAEQYKAREERILDGKLVD